MTVPCRSLRAQHRRPARLLQALAKGVAWRVGIAYPARPDPRGEVPEWSNGAVSKTVDPSRGPRVRIPVSPPRMPWFTALVLPPAGGAVSPRYDLAALVLRAEEIRVPAAPHRRSRHGCRASLRHRRSGRAPTAWHQDSLDIMEPRGGIVVDKDIDVRCSIAGEDDSTRDDRFAAGRRTSSLASQPVAMTTSSAPSALHASGIRETVEMEGDARHAAFVEPPGDDRQHRATALQP